MDRLHAIGTERDCPVAVIVREGRLLVGYRHYTSAKWKDISVWTLPGGRCDPGETVEEGLRREVREEIGVTELRITSRIGTVPGVKEGDVVHLFAAETDQEPRNCEPHKFSEWAWADIESVKEHFINLAAYDVIKEYLARNRLAPPA